MNVEIRAEAALFPEKEYISGIFVALHSTEYYFSYTVYGIDRKLYSVHCTLTHLA
jgi:hypothetical protein